LSFSPLYAYGKGHFVVVLEVSPGPDGYVNIFDAGTGEVRTIPIEDFQKLASGYVACPKSSIKMRNILLGILVGSGFAMFFLGAVLHLTDSTILLGRRDI
jgi:hypothetical protein